MGWQRLTLPPSPPGSTISAGELNCRVRDGSGCTLTAHATNSQHLSARSSRLFSLVEPQQATDCIAAAQDRSLLFHTPRQSTRFPASSGQSPRPLVPVSSSHYWPSTPGLSNSSSSSGLTLFRDGESHLEVSFPLRCFQRLSAPEIATRPCRWRDNRRTSAPSTPVLSY